MKSSTTNLFTLVGLLFEPSISISKPKGYLEASIYIRQTYVTVTYNSHVIPLSILRSLFSSSMLITNSRIVRLEADYEALLVVRSEIILTYVE